MAAGEEQMGMRPGVEKSMKKQIAPTQAVYNHHMNLTGVRLLLIEDWMD